MVNFERSSADLMWETGLDSYWNKDYFESKKNFEQIYANEPSHPYVQNVLKEVNNKYNQFGNVGSVQKDAIPVSVQKEKGNNTRLNYIPILIIFAVAGFVLLQVIYICLFIIIFKRIKKRK